LCNFTAQTCTQTNTIYSGMVYNLVDYTVYTPHTHYTQYEVFSHTL